MVDLAAIGEGVRIEFLAVGNLVKIEFSWLVLGRG